METSFSKAEFVADTPPAAREPAGDGAEQASPDEAVERTAARRRVSLWNAPATYFLLAANIVVFLVMSVYGPLPALFHSHAFGGTLLAPFDINLLAAFGGCDGAQVLVQHQWWRVLTACFVHGNLLHLLVNLWCLWNLGLLGEPLLGRRGLLATYALTGIAGNLLSLGFHALRGDDALVVGASGSVFGIAGILVVLLSNRRLSLPWEELRKLRGSVIQFAVLNLVIGLAPQMLMPVLPGAALDRLPASAAILTRIDNSAHLGGFLCGLLMGWPLFSKMLSGREKYRRRQGWAFAGTAVLLAGAAAGVMVLRGR